MYCVLHVSSENRLLHTNGMCYVALQTVYLCRPTTEMLSLIAKLLSAASACIVGASRLRQIDSELNYYYSLSDMCAADRVCSADHPPISQLISMTQTTNY